MISSTESVVGIDAKKNHIIIIHKLMEIFKGLYARKKPPSNIDATHHDVPVYQ